MKAKALVVVTAVLLVAADEAAKSDVDKVQGVWETTSLELNGKDMQAADGVKLKFTFKGHKVTLEGDENIVRDYGAMSFKLNPSTKPKSIDMTITSGDRKDTVLEGIYEFKGDELRICTKLDEKQRPAKFAAPEGENTALITLKRAKT